MSKVVTGNWNDMPWMPRYNEKNEYRGRKKLFTGSRATVQCMEFCNGHPVSPHKHDYEQIAMIWSGICDFYVDGVPYRMTAGSYIVIPPQSEHYIHVYDSPVPVINMDVFIPKRDQYAQQYEDFLKAKEIEK